MEMKYSSELLCVLLLKTFIIPIHNINWLESKLCINSSTRGDFQHAYWSCDELNLALLQYGKTCYLILTWSWADEVSAVGVDEKVTASLASLAGNDEQTVRAV